MSFENSLKRASTSIAMFQQKKQKHSLQKVTLNERSRHDLSLKGDWYSTELREQCTNNARYHLKSRSFWSKAYYCNTISTRPSAGSQGSFRQAGRLKMQNHDTLSGQRLIEPNTGAFNLSCTWYHPFPKSADQWCRGNISRRPCVASWVRLICHGVGKRPKQWLARNKNERQAGGWVWSVSCRQTSHARAFSWWFTVTDHNNL